VGPAAAGEPTLDGDSQLREHSLAGDAAAVQILPRSEPDSSNLNCAQVGDQRVIANDMEEALDFEVGRFLVAIGIAREAPGWIANLQA
jgi:hypothetical protein